MGQSMLPIGLGVGVAAAGIATGGAALPMIGLGMTAMSAAGSVIGGMDQQQAYQAQSQQYVQQAKLTMIQAKVDEAQRLIGLNRALGTNKAAAGAMNIDVDSPSAVAIADYNKDQVIAQIGLTKLSAETQVNRLMMASVQDISAGSSAFMSGLTTAGTSIFGGINDYLKVGGPAGATDSAILGPLAGSPVI